jgi:hypothetical protein
VSVHYQCTDWRHRGEVRQNRAFGLGYRRIQLGWYVSSLLIEYPFLILRVFRLQGDMWK